MTELRTIAVSQTRSALVCLTVALATPCTGQEVGDARRGLAYAQEVCASCHGVLATDTVSPRPGTATFKVIANTPGMTETALAVWLQTSHKSMPNFIIEPADRSDVIAYIVSLRDKRAAQ